MPVSTFPAAVDSPLVFQSGRELLSLALIDARNHTLHLLAQFGQSAEPEGAGTPAALRMAGHAAWLGELWIARNPRRGLGAACPADVARLASLEPRADDWFDPRIAGSAPVLDAATVRAYMLETLETTLELLERAEESADGLYFFRMALHHEDLRATRLAALAQACGVPLALPLPPGAAAREPLGLPAQRWTLGAAREGFVPAIERGTQAQDVPEFEIDAQPVSWEQYVEFIADGGYDRQELWSARGWDWLQRQHTEGRRGPRHVEQIGVASGAVMQSVFGRQVRMGRTQPAMHVSWWEAEAYARWAQRRLPTEAEWEIAAVAAARRGFRFGDVAEWTAGTLRPWNGYVPDPWAASAGLDPQPVFGQARVLKGAPFVARQRSRHPRARAWALPEDDAGFTGFRTCAY